MSKVVYVVDVSNSFISMALYGYNLMINWPLDHEINYWLSAVPWLITVYLYCGMRERIMAVVCIRKDILIFFFF